MSKYDKVFQQHARDALAANPFEPLVMVRADRSNTYAHDLALPARIRTTLPTIGLI